MIERIILFLLSLFGFRGAYFPDFDYIVCNDVSTCIHEQGHRMDYALGLPSQTSEFKEAISAFPFVLENNTCLVNTEMCKHKEAYAILWQAVEGSIYSLPEEFQQFYKE